MPTFIAFNAASAVQYADVIKGDFRMQVAVPTLPTATQARKFGLFAVDRDSGLYFEVTGTTFRAVARDATSVDGSTTSTITFEPSWAGTPIEYRILWEAGLAHFYVDGTRKATIAFPASNILTSIPLSLYVSNSVADNLLVGYIDSLGVQSFTRVTT